MTFSFYHSLITQPKELDEAARMFRLTKWERFWHLDVPSSMIGLVWNGALVHPHLIDLEPRPGLPRVFEPKIGR